MMMRCCHAPPQADMHWDAALVRLPEASLPLEALLTRMPIAPRVWRRLFEADIAAGMQEADWGWAPLAPYRRA